MTAAPKRPTRPYAEEYLQSRRTALTADDFDARNAASRWAVRVLEDATNAGVDIDVDAVEQQLRGELNVQLHAPKLLRRRLEIRAERWEIAAAQLGSGPSADPAVRADVWARIETMRQCAADLRAALARDDSDPV